MDWCLGEKCEAVEMMEECKLFCMRRSCRIEQASDVEGIK